MDTYTELVRGIREIDSKLTDLIRLAASLGSIEQDGLVDLGNGLDSIINKADDLQQVLGELNPIDIPWSPTEGH